LRETLKDFGSRNLGAVLAPEADFLVEQLHGSFRLVPKFRVLNQKVLGQRPALTPSEGHFLGQLGGQWIGSRNHEPAFAEC